MSAKTALFAMPGLNAEAAITAAAALIAESREKPRRFFVDDSAVTDSGRGARATPRARLAGDAVKGGPAARISGGIP